jgi:hypothetical protein
MVIDGRAVGTDILVESAYCVVGSGMGEPRLRTPWPGLDRMCFSSKQETPTDFLLTATTM